jgi:hypothetical protein
MIFTAIDFDRTYKFLAYGGSFYLGFVFEGELKKFLKFWRTPICQLSTRQAYETDVRGDLSVRVLLFSRTPSRKG